jgi:hypothetical protein
VEARSFEEESHFSDWALTFIFLGRPIGAVLAGGYIKHFQKYKLLLRINLVITFLLFLLYALGVIRQLLHVIPTKKYTLKFHIGPQDPRYCPFLLLLGFNIGISEGCLLVSLLSVVGKEGLFTPSHNLCIPFRNLPNINQTSRPSTPSSTLRSH